ncbi:hypothetical protein Peur_071600 [Populus x canadensis]
MLKDLDEGCQRARDFFKRQVDFQQNLSSVLFMCKCFRGKNVKAAYGVCRQRGRSCRLQNAGRRNFLKVQLVHNLMSWKLDSNTFLMAFLHLNLKLKSGPIVSISGFVDFIGSSGRWKIPIEVLRGTLGDT